ncbi:MAG: ABC transporter substrate-binding protein [Tannerella sp.]|jgi:iron complex transport system substrate-binding protein|nr:ABC transporter substrate-binding protein [Tannerella sp.]
MISNRLINNLFLLAVTLVVTVGCRPGSRIVQGEYRTITDMAGRTLEIPVEIDAVFAGRHPIHALYAFDTAITVNNVFRYTETEKKYLKRSFYEGKPYALEDASEEIVRLAPDIVLFSDFLTPDNIERADELQKKLQIPVVLMDNDILNYKQTLAFLGGLLRKEEKAAELIGFVEKYVDPIPVKAKDIPDEQRKRVYYAEGMKGLNTDPSGSVHSLMIDLAGGVNVAQTDILPGKGMTGVSLEQIYRWNPDLILVWSGNFDGMDSYREILVSPAWRSLEAVKRNAVYQVPWRPFGWIDRPPGMNRLIGIVWLANLLYPDVFQNDMNVVTKEFFWKFYHYDMTDEEVREIVNTQPNI